MITTQEALGQTRTIVSAVEHALDRAMAQARRLIQGGQGIDDHQVHCARLAYRATELQAAQALLHYAEMQGQHGQDDGVTGHMALAYAAEVHQTLLAEVWYWAGCPRHQWGQYHLVRGRNGCYDAAIGTRLHAPGSRTYGGVGAPP